jgi:hypothetical protein
MSVRNEKTRIETITNGFAGVNRFTSDDNVDSNMLYIAQNVDLTKGPGYVMTSPGYSVGANIASGTLYGAYCFFESTPGTIPLAHIGDTMYRYVGSWSATSLTTLAEVNSQFTTFLDYVFVTDGTQVLSSDDGSSWGSDKLTSAPTTGIIDMEAFNGRLYFLEKDTLNWSSIATPALDITWNTTDFNVEVNPFDGDYNTALTKLRQRLLIFKRYSTYRFYQYADTSLDLKPVSEKVGVPNPRAFALDPDGTLCYLFGTSVNGYRGIYVTDGESMNIISRPIQDILDGVSESMFDEICAEVIDNKVKFFIGDVTLKDGSIIPRCEIQYSPVDKLWQWRSLSHTPVIYEPFVVGSTRSLYFLDTSSNIYQDEVGSTFGGNPIHSEIETLWRRFAEPATLLTSRELTITGKNLSKMQSRLKTIDNNRWLSKAARVEKKFINQSQVSATGTRFKVNLTWTQPTMSYEADRVAIERIYLGFKQKAQSIK